MCFLKKMCETSVQTGTVGLTAGINRQPPEFQVYAKRLYSVQFWRPVNWFLLARPSGVGIGTSELEKNIGRQDFSNGLFSPLNYK
jgi:hypothetical protein